MTELDPASARHHRQVVQLLERGNVVVLTGAGLSTASGIPDYRDREGRWKRKQPVGHREFLASAAVRRRYWARSFLGWPVVGQAQPGRGHRALADLEARGRIALTVTQNVDGLHQKAGSRAVLELHGGVACVVCLACCGHYPRSEVQDWMRAANPAFADVMATAAPDGDADAAEGFDESFAAPDCPACGGMLKPEVVFFGDSVPKARVGAVSTAIDAAAGLLVVGSSLMVYSGYRFAEYAHRQGKPVMAINLGMTRADHLFAAKVERDCGESLASMLAES